jgi:uncharacterized protein (TIGR01777 family)
VRILVSGASGFIGTRIVGALAKQRHEVLRLTRGPLSPDDPRLFYWDVDRGEIDPRAVEGVDVVIHLAGENLSAKRWSPAFKAQILDSRVKSTRLLLDAISEQSIKPQAFIAATAIGFYGDRGLEELNESSTGGGDFLAQLCQSWEGETAKAADQGMRLVQMRIGMVLGREGGALAKMILPFKLGAGGKIGSGKQYYSWITADDLVKAVLFFIEHPETSGIYNCVAPNPVTNAQFTASMGRAVGRPAFMPLPAFAARLVFGEMADALLLGSQKVNPQRLKAAGFQWEHPFIGEALNKVVND